MILPKPCLGRGTMRSMVEGFVGGGGYPSTTLWMVPLPIRRMGRIS
jgi:hypothetical protein